MDNIKDSSKIDTKNQLSSLSVVSIYGLENSDDSIKDKVERLSAVVYLATNHIKDIDPIKLSVREVCLNCLKTVNDTPSFIGQTNLSPQFSEILISPSAIAHFVVPIPLKLSKDSPIPAIGLSPSIDDIAS